MKGRELPLGPSAADMERLKALEAEYDSLVGPRAPGDRRPIERDHRLSLKSVPQRVEVYERVLAEMRSAAGGAPSPPQAERTAS